MVAIKSEFERFKDRVKEVCESGPFPMRFIDGPVELPPEVQATLDAIFGEMEDLPPPPLPPGFEWGAFYLGNDGGEA